MSSQYYLLDFFCPIEEFELAPTAFLEGQELWVIRENYYNDFKAWFGDCVANITYLPDADPINDGINVYYIESADMTMNGNDGVGVFENYELIQTFGDIYAVGSLWQPDVTLRPDEIQSSLFCEVQDALSSLEETIRNNSRIQQAFLQLHGELTQRLQNNPQAPANAEEVYAALQSVLTAEELEQFDSLLNLATGGVGIAALFSKLTTVSLEF